MACLNPSSLSIISCIFDILKGLRLVCLFKFLRSERNCTGWIGHKHVNFDTKNITFLKCSFKKIAYTRIRSIFHCNSFQFHVHYILMIFIHLPHPFNNTLDVTKYRSFWLRLLKCSLLGFPLSWEIYEMSWYNLLPWYICYMVRYWILCSIFGKSWNMKEVVF